MENTAKVIEYINQHTMVDYVQKLTKVEMNKITLFTPFPIIGAANISDPQYFIEIKNPEAVAALLASHLN